ncbi:MULTISPECIES: hypothetical protein [unclassified Sphingomonas]|uniref:hypothetical protein n=1 Tax=unclassified Sphingomonas TaxID=196159 RepID=UPI001D12BBA8|nr:MULTISPECIES: hypothetical protein [unclassified Sphingomonas]MCC2979238.1 hypothetical protein [Sphingomonas sp. IC4-52]MCD2315528.1 hypothetical protein [Sphingomonas sp. IC-11]
MTDDPRQPQHERPPRIPHPDDPVTFVDRPERDPDSGRHLIFVAIALVTMVLFWWGI